MGSQEVYALDFEAP